MGRWNSLPLLFAIAIGLPEDPSPVTLVDESGKPVASAFVYFMHVDQDYLALSPFRPPQRFRTDPEGRLPVSLDQVLQGYPAVRFWVEKGNYATPPAIFNLWRPEKIVVQFRWSSQISATVTVTDEMGNPVPDARVVLWSLTFLGEPEYESSGLTDQQGRVALRARVIHDPAVTKDHLQCALLAYHPTKGSALIKTTADKLDRVFLTLKQQKPAQIRLRDCLDKSLSKPIAVRLMMLAREGDRTAYLLPAWLFTFQTSSNGVLSLPIPAGMTATWKLTSRYEPFWLPMADQKRFLRIAPGQKMTVTHHRRTVEIRGTVHYKDGTPCRLPVVTTVRNAFIPYLLNGTQTFITRPDQKGQFRVIIPIPSPPRPSNPLASESHPPFNDMTCFVLQFADGKEITVSPAHLAKGRAFDPCWRLWLSPVYVDKPDATVTIKVRSSRPEYRNLPIIVYAIYQEAIGRITSKVVEAGACLPIQMQWTASIKETRGLLWRVGTVDRPFRIRLPSGRLSIHASVCVKTSKSFLLPPFLSLQTPIFSKQPFGPLAEPFRPLSNIDLKPGESSELELRDENILETEIYNWEMWKLLEDTGA
ncbi:MAG: Ig-like domain-containing protein [Armatimonadetes bacterium]|nr:Ig-like domain-containing protein [Armatimonadota bacterium]MDW8122412.1 Ig-like domain-containing protein [Armatimonadota bacterium]